MNSQKSGSSFEIITKHFFTWLFEKLGFIVIKDRIQFSGTQNGFDILIIVVKDYDEHKIFIECKNYKTDLQIGNILKKAWDLKKDYSLGVNDLFIAINPRSNFKNEDNSEKSSPLLNEIFEFRSYLLDVSNGIKSLFGLNNLIFKEIYNYDIDFKVDEEKELEKFKAIIFSRKPFKRIILKGKDEHNYLGQIRNDDYYIERTFSINESGFKGSIYKNKDLKISDILSVENNLFVLGNPGCGKSTELKKIAISNWKIGEQNGYTPVYKNLKNFTNTDNVVDYLPKGYLNLNKVLVILDGIDEVADIEYFKSKLENFIQEVQNHKKLKIIISCRTNVYESIVNNISGFKTYYLNDLTIEESRTMLIHYCGEIAKKINLDNSSINEFLNNPFQVKLLAEYINVHRKLPSNTSELWENYINKRLSNDEKEKLKKLNLNIPLIKDLSKKISLIGYTGAS